MARDRKILKGPGKRGRSSAQDDGVSAVEFSLIAMVLFFSLFAVIDLSRYFYARTVSQNALAYAIKHAQSEFNTVIEFDQSDATSDSYQKFNTTRSAIIGEAEQRLNEMTKSVRFFEARDIDDLRDGMRLNQPKRVAFLLPGKASFVSDPAHAGEQPLILQNQNICWKRAGRPIDQDGVEYHVSENYSCTAGKYRTNESYQSLTKLYPLELVSTAKFSGIIARDISFTVRAAGFLPERTDGPTTHRDTPTPTPTTQVTITPDWTPTPEITSTPTITPVLTVNTPTKTPTPIVIITSTPTPPPTQTPTPTPYLVVTNTPTATPSATPTQVRTATPTNTPTKTPAPSLCPDPSVAMRSLDGGTQKHDGQRFVLRIKDLVWDAVRKVWYDDQGGSTFACIENSWVTAAANGQVNLGYNFGYRRSGAGRGDVSGRKDFAIDFLRQVAQSEAGRHACFICGLIRHRKGCFPPGVKIATGDGTTFKKVEEVSAGDMIWNPFIKKAFKVQTVSEGPEENPLVQIKAGNLTLRVSGEHPVLTGEGIKQAKAVKVGDTVQDADLKVLVVDQVIFEPAPAGLSVINFVLERDGHEHGGVLLADGVAVGDLVTQKNIATPE